MRRVKLVVFDLDGTLAEIGKPILPKNIEMLKAMEEQGGIIAICSGKPTYYLCGFLRQVGLKQPILIGENGAVIQFGVDLPPKHFYILPYSEEARKTIAFIRNKWETLLPNMWYQPNLVGLTPFPKRKEEFGVIEDFLKENEKDIMDVDVYRFGDCFDIIPKGISKKEGVAYLGKLLNIEPQEMVAVGDGENDYPMLSYVGCSVGIHLKEKERAKHNFATIGEALEWLMEGIETYH